MENKKVKYLEKEYVIAEYYKNDTLLIIEESYLGAYTVSGIDTEDSILQISGHEKENIEENMAPIFTVIDGDSGACVGYSGILINDKSLDYIK